MLTLKRGVLLTVEGIDGSGKSTLMTNLGHQLATHQLPLVLTREPGQTKLGTHIRSLVQERSMPMGAKAEYLLFAANRAQHFDEFVIPHLRNHALVISDRLADSSLVYQGYARGLDLHTIDTVNNWAMNSHKPDVVIYVRVPLETALARIAQRGNLSSFEQEHAFTRKVFEGYESLVAGRKDVLVVDGQQPPETVAQSTASLILDRLRAQGLLS